ncbi:MAG: MFS transporter [Candidatus Rehaiarchaeum fermentans]|nr:MFS transporter [Candidatus Rehaiarchaeum fermentans]
MQYKYTVLANTTLGGLMASINSTILLISLPAIFRGININPLASNTLALLLWILLGYMIVTASFLVTFGKISDIYGRKKFYTIGFTIFAIASVLLSLTPSNSGEFGAYYIIILRIVQAIGGGFIMVNGTALLTDAFPSHERGKALGINQIAFVAGGFLGIIIGGLLSFYDFHIIFLVSVPFAIAGALWAQYKLKEENYRTNKKGIKDYLGNVFLAASLVCLVLGFTYALIPYKNSQLGWNNPFVLLAFSLSVIFFILFIIREMKTKEPFLNLHLFKLRSFSFGSLALLFNSLAQGALMFLIVIWLQAIYLPAHGFSYESTPFWAGIYMMPLMISVVIFGPLGGTLTDKYGAREIATIGLIIMIIGFALLTTLPANFNLYEFLAILFFTGIGNGLFAAPNTTAIMNSLPIDVRGEGNGVRQTIGNVARVVSLSMFFTIAITYFVTYLPSQINNYLSSLGAPSSLIKVLSNIPGSDLLFASLLGYNPINYLPSQISSLIPSSILNSLKSTTFLPNVISSPFIKALRISFAIGIAMLIIATIFSALRGGKFVNTERIKK